MSRKPTRWRFDDPLLLWLFPGSYVAHFLEELLATAPVIVWNARLDRPLGVAAFMTWSAIALALMIAGVRLVGRGPRFDWIASALATAFLLNAAGHVAGSVTTGRYSAGLATAVILWVPLGLLMLTRVATQASRRTLWTGIGVGAAIEATVWIVTAQLAR